MGPRDGGRFDEERARGVLGSAGFAARDAELLALGENAVFGVGPHGPRGSHGPHGPRGPVVRIGRSPELLDRMRREVRVAEWLADQGVPAVRPAEPEARLVAGHPVSVWQRLPEPERQAKTADLAALLRLVHRLPAPPFPLPRRDLLGGVERWLRLAGSAIDPADAAYLRERRDHYAAAADHLTPHLSPGPIHGDALPRNVHIGPDGPVLLDLETFSDDLREHDLVVMALALDRYGLDPAAYDAFAGAYGWDVREWEECAVLRGARETASCAWVAQHAPANPAALAEFRRRVASLREGDPTVRWHAF